MNVVTILETITVDKKIRPIQEWLNVITLVLCVCVCGCVLMFKSTISWFM